MRVRPPRSLAVPIRFVVPFVVLALLAAACNSDGSGDSTPDLVGTGGPLVQARFYADYALPLWAAFGQGIGESFEIDTDSVSVLDVSEGGLEYDSSAERDRFEFALANGLLGQFSADFLTPDGEQLWGMTTMVFREHAGALATYEKFGNPDSFTIGGTSIVQEGQEPIGGEHAGDVFVQAFEYEDGRGRTYGLRGSLVEDNLLHHVVALLDVPPGGSLDGFGTLRRAFTSIMGIYRQAWDEVVRAQSSTTTQP